MRTLGSVAVVCMLAVVASNATAELCHGQEPIDARQKAVAAPDTIFEAAGAADSISAETPPGEDSLAVYGMDEVLITASRLPSSRELYFSNVAVATKNDISKISSSTLAEALTIDSGVGLTRHGSYGSLQTMSMRGGSSKEVVYLVDGVPISDPQISSVDLNWLPRSGTLRVEAMKGAASSLYGSGAITGAVNVVSMDPIAPMPATEIMFWNGNFGSRTVGVTLRRALAGNMGVMGAYDYMTSNGWVANSACDAEKMYARLSERRGGLNLDAVVFTHAGETNIPGDFPGRQNDSRKFFKVSVSRAGDSDVAIDYYHSSSRRTYSPEDACGWGSFSEHEGSMDGLRVGITRMPGEQLAASLDGGFEHRQIESSSVGKRDAHDFYGSVRGEVNRDPWRLAGSARLERNSEFDLETALQLAAWFFAGRRWTLFCKADRSFMYPSFNDLFWKGSNEAGDPDLKTEHSNGVEISAFLERGRFEAAATGYYRSVPDMIVWQVDASDFLWKPTNVATALKGVEACLRLAPVDGVKASISYWMGEATDRGTGEALKYRPARVISWSAEGERALSRHVTCGVTIAGRLMPAIRWGDQWAPPDSCKGDWTPVPNTLLPAYSSVTLHAFLGIDRGRVFGRVNNLFDDRIVTSWSKQGLALPGRCYEVGLELELLD